MKVLLVDTACDGHHISYISSLLDALKNDECKLISPEKIPVDCDQTICNRDFKKKQYRDYFALMSMVLSVAREFKPDIVHFLYGDYFYRFFGVGLGQIKNSRIVMTFHSIRRGKLLDISLHNLFFHAADMSVVHTKALLDEVKEMGVNKVQRIDYPCFMKQCEKTKDECCRKIGLATDVPVLGVYGSTRYDKGLDLLLEALNKVEHPFQLLIAGKAEAFDEAYISEHTVKYSDSVHMKLEYLTDDDLQECMNAADIIVLPYRRIFNGASGPLTDGVFMGKRVIAASHGSLGSVVTENHLGVVFETENITSLAEAISHELSLKEQIMDAEAFEYIKLLSPELFKDRYMNLYRRFAME